MPGGRARRTRGRRQRREPVHAQRLSQALLGRRTRLDGLPKHSARLGGVVTFAKRQGRIERTKTSKRVLLGWHGHSFHLATSWRVRGTGTGWPTTGPAAGFPTRARGASARVQANAVPRRRHSHDDCGVAWLELLPGCERQDLLVCRRKTLEGGEHPGALGAIEGREGLVPLDDLQLLDQRATAASRPELRRQGLTRDTEEPGPVSGGRSLILRQATRNVSATTSSTRASGARRRVYVRTAEKCSLKRTSSLAASSVKDASPPVE